MCIGCVYRPPTAPVSFWQNLAESADHATSSSNATLFLLGDLNVNILAPERHPQHRHLSELCDTLSLHNVVLEPTRSPSNTCLDLILVAQALPSEVTLKPVAVQSLDGVSDHFLVSLILALAGSQPHRVLLNHRKIRSPPVRQLTAEEFGPDFLQSLRATDCSDMSVDQLSTVWSDAVLQTVDQHCPRRSVTLSSHPPPQPWVTPGLQSLYQRKAYLHRRWLRDRDSDSARQCFRAARRECQILQRRLQTEYFTNRFFLSRFNPRAQWQVLNHLLGRKQQPTTLPVDVPALSAVFAAQVSDPTLNTGSQLPLGPSKATGFTTFRPVSPTDVERRLCKLDEWKATGSDDIPASLLRASSKYLAASLAEIYNNSLATGVFPEQYKLAQICPVFKKGDKNAPTNYRPISLLPIVSKVLERIVYDQFRQFMVSAGDVIPDEQFAYRSCHSCGDALALCIDSWQRSLDSGNVVAVAFLDLSKAFDCVLHGELLLELQRCGVGGTVLQWFSSYLSSRPQQVKCLRQPPGTPYTANRGVPQGSVLGPALFTVYTRRLPACLQSSLCLLYADDTNIYAADPSPSTATQTLEHDLTRVSSFLEAHGLQLNPSKTQFLLLRKPNVHADCSLQFCNSRIQQSQQAKYLGIIIDEHLSFQQQVSHIRSKVNAKVNAFRRCRHHLSARAKRTFYLAFVQSTLEYASNAYVHCLRQTTYNALISIANRAIRTVFGFPPSASIQPILARQHLTPLNIRYAANLYVFLHRCINARASPLLCRLFTPRAVSLSRTARITRSQELLGLVLPHARLYFGYHSVSYLGADRWNALPAAIRTISLPAAFRSAIFTWLGHPVRRP